jgi:hypothetical protein
VIVLGVLRARKIQRGESYGISSKTTLDERWTGTLLTNSTGVDSSMGNTCHNYDCAVNVQV